MASFHSNRKQIKFIFSRNTLPALTIYRSIVLGMLMIAPGKAMRAEANFPLALYGERTKWGRVSGNSVSRYERNRHSVLESRLHVPVHFITNDKYCVTYWRSDTILLAGSGAHLKR